MRAIIPVLAVLSLLLSACDFIPSQEEATETAVAIRATVTAEAAAAQTEEASAAATAAVAAVPTEEPEDGAGDDDAGESAADEGPTVTITTADGCEITLFGSPEAIRGANFIVRWRVVCDGNPGSGTFFATLGDPPSSPDATHASGELDGEGEVTLTLDVNWGTGETILYCSFGGEVYEVTDITISDG
jgi:hypothetical protein